MGSPIWRRRRLDPVTELEAWQIEDGQKAARPLSQSASRSQADGFWDVMWQTAPQLVGAAGPHDGLIVDDRSEGAPGKRATRIAIGHH